jgi:hypothetical protein
VSMIAVQSACNYQGVRRSIAVPNEYPARRSPNYGLRCYDTKRLPRQSQQTASDIVPSPASSATAAKAGPGISHANRGGSPPRSPDPGHLAVTDGASFTITAGGESAAVPVGPGRPGTRSPMSGAQLDDHEHHAAGGQQRADRPVPRRRR